MPAKREPLTIEETLRARDVMKYVWEWSEVCDEVAVGKRVAKQKKKKNWNHQK